MIGKNEILELGKIPPQAIEIEEAVLGALLLDKQSYYVVCEFLKMECFYKQENQIIYQIIDELNRENKSIDLLTVANKLKSLNKLDEVGGATYLAQLTSKIGSSANVEFHARIVKDMYLKREYIRISSEIIKMSYDQFNDIEDISSFSEKSILELSKNNIQSVAEQVGKIINKSLEEIEQANISGKNLLGISSGLVMLDKLTNGWQNTDLIILAARPSMGKTAFAIRFGLEASMKNISTIIFSLEMSKQQIGNRILASEIDLSPMLLRSGKFQQNYWQKIENSLTKLIKIPLFIDDECGLNVFKLKSKIRRYKMTLGIEFVIIDYLQLIHGDRKNGNREQEISEITREIKSIAKEIDIPIILLSQLNRDLEKRSNKRPQLSDLRESGAIEQDADMVLFLYRAEKYGIFEDESGMNTKGKTDVIISKYRNGSIGTITVHNNESLTKIWDNEEIIEENIF